MNGFHVPKEKAQVVKEYLTEHHLLDKMSLLVKDDNTITFPILSKSNLLKVFPFGTFITARFPSVQKKQTFKEALVALLTPAEQQHKQQHIISGFDVIGDIAIVEIPPELRKKEKKIAQLLLGYAHVKTVVKKGTIHHGTYRVQRMVHLAGKRTMETIYRESGIKVKLNVSKVYFSPRLAEERKRIAALVKPKEKVLVLFSGVGIYPMVIAHNTSASLVYGIELNPIGHKYALINKELNHLQNIEFICGDAGKEIRKLHVRFDRIIMPLPKNAADFLGSALAVAKKGTVVHFYDFFPEKDIPHEPKTRIRQLCRKWKIPCRIITVVKCGQYAPYVSRVCIDFSIG